MEKRFLRARAFRRYDLFPDLLFADTLQRVVPLLLLLLLPDAALSAS